MRVFKEQTYGRSGSCASSGTSRRCQKGNASPALFIAPSRTFTDLRRNANWWAPFLITAIVSLLFVYVVDQKVGFRKV